MADFFTQRAMEKFVRKLFRDTDNLSTLTQRIVRQKYAEHCDVETISEQDRQELKRIVSKLVLEHSNGGDEDENGDEKPCRRSPRKSAASPSPRKQKKARSTPSTAGSSSTLSSWARTPPKTRPTGGGGGAGGEKTRHYSADEALKAVLESSPEKSPRKPISSPRKPRSTKSSLSSPRKPSLPSPGPRLSSPRRRPPPVTDSPRRSPRKAVKAASARSASKMLSAEQARDKLLNPDLEEEEEEEEGDLLGEDEFQDSGDSDSTWEGGLESSGTKRTKWNSLVPEREKKIRRKLQDSDEEPSESFRDEAPLGLYNSSDSSMSDSSSISSGGSGSDESDFDDEPPARGKKSARSKANSSQKKRELSKSKFAELKMKRSKKMLTKKGKGQTPEVADDVVLLKKRPGSVSDDESSCLEILSQAGSQGSDSDASPVKPTRVKRNRKNVISESESDWSSSPVKANSKKKEMKNKPKTILDLGSEGALPRGSSSESDDEPKPNSKISSPISKPVPNIAKSKTNAAKPKPKLAKMSSTESESDLENEDVASPPQKHSKKTKSKQETEANKKRKRAVSSSGSSESNSDTDTEAKPSKTKGKSKKPEPKKRKKAENEDPTKTNQVKNLEKIARAATGILPVGKRYKETFQDCTTSKDRIAVLLNLFREAGFTGTPTMKQAAVFKLKREAAELDQDCIISSDRGSRSSRTRKVNYGFTPSKPLQTKPCTVRITPFKNKIANMADLIDTEGSDSD